MIRVLLVEDDAWVRRGVARVLAGAVGKLSVVGSCGTAREALDLLNGGLDMEVALVDLKLPDQPGHDVIRAIRRLRPKATPVALTIFDDAASVLDALRAGARGYLLKDTPPERLIAGIEEAANGGAPMTPSVARLVVDALGASPPPIVPSGEDALTPRERDVLERLTQGFTYEGIAHALGVGLSTVQGHIKSIYRKLEVRSKSEATAVAMKRGLVAR